MMKKSMNCKRLLLIGTTAIVIVTHIISCTKENCRTSEIRKQQEAATVAYSHADSMVFAAGFASNYERMLQLADSLETVGVFSELNANRWRGVAYNYLGQNRMSEFYYQKAVNAKIVSLEDSMSYIKSARRLSELLVRRKEYSEAIKLATNTLDIVKNMKDDHPKDMAILLTTIATCELNTNEIMDAKDNFEKVYNLYKQITEADSTGRALFDAVNGMEDIVHIFLNQGLVEDATPWVRRLEDFIEGYVNKENHDPKYYDRFQADLLLSKATLFSDQNQPKAAAEAYQNFLKTDFGKTAKGKIAANEYLMRTKQYVAAANNYAKLDEVLGEQGVMLNLDNIQDYIIPKLKANIEAGRRDSVVNVAANLCTVIDSAIYMNKTDEAAELATIYGTEQKETEIARQKAQIAESEADLSNQRLITLGVVISLLVLFFTIYAIKHRQHEQQLESANKKLENANLQLEDKNKALTIAREKAEEASKMKTNFIMQISHEVRTPLNILSGFAQVITMPGMELGEEEKVEINNGIMENTERITGLVNKMLELSDVGSETNIAKTDHVTAQDIAKAAIQKSGIDQATHLQFQYHIAPILVEYTFMSNIEQAARALSLLLDNAMKFTHPAEAAVKVAGGIDKVENASLQVLPNGDDKVDFVVCDTGIGVPVEEAEHIFEEFVQLDDYYDGTGIGLTIARSIVRRLGGDVVLDTTYSSGAKFVMTLPI